MKFKTYSFRDAETLFEFNDKYNAEWEEVVDTLNDITEDEVIEVYNKSLRDNKKSLSEAINYLIDEKLVAKSWDKQSEIFKDKEYSGNSKLEKHPWRLDFSKNNISIEVGFNHGSVVAWNLIKLALAGELNHVSKKINTSAGILIAATDDLKKEGGFDGAVGSYEKYLQYLKPLRNMLTVPMMIVGIDAFDDYTLICKQVVRKKDLLPTDNGKKFDLIIAELKNNNINFDFVRFKEKGYNFKNNSLIRINKSNLFLSKTKGKNFEKLKQENNDYHVIAVKDIITIEEIIKLINDYL